MSQDILIALFTILAVWLAILTALILWIVKFFRNLSRDVKRGSLTKVLDKVLDVERKNSSDIKKLFREIKRIDTEKSFHVQKMGVVRFNPFNEMGGDHSFVLTLLDGHGTGFIITGLHTRERTRIYIKDVKKGASEYKLSVEEKKSLRDVME